MIEGAFFDSMRLPRKNTVSRQGLVICSILAALMLARFSPSTSPQSLSPHSAIGSLSARPHRPCLDRERADWASPTNAFVLSPQPFVSAELMPELDPQLPFSIEGPYYNRPPPTV